MFKPLDSESSAFANYATSALLVELVGLEPTAGDLMRVPGRRGAVYVTIVATDNEAQAVKALLGLAP